MSACAGCGIKSNSVRGSDADPFTECPGCSLSFCSDCKSVKGRNGQLEEDADRSCRICTGEATEAQLVAQLEAYVAKLDVTL